MKLIANINTNSSNNPEQDPKNGERHPQSHDPNIHIKLVSAGTRMQWRFSWNQRVIFVNHFESAGDRELGVLVEIGKVYV